MHLVEIKDTVEVPDEQAGEQLVKLLLEVDTLAEGTRQLLARAKSSSIRSAAKDVGALAQAMRLSISLGQDGPSLADTAHSLCHATQELKLLTEKSSLDATIRAAILLLNTLSLRLREAVLAWVTQGR